MHVCFAAVTLCMRWARAVILCRLSCAFCVLRMIVKYGLRRVIVQLRSSGRFQTFNQPPAHFPREGGVVPHIDATHHKFTTNTKLQLLCSCAHDR